MTKDEFSRKLSFRSWHRGTREMDLLMGHFSDFILPILNEDGLNDYARMLEENDPDLYDYYCGRKSETDIADDVSRDLLQKFKDFKVS